MKGLIKSFLLLAASTASTLAEENQTCSAEEHASGTCGKSSLQEEDDGKVDSEDSGLLAMIGTPWKKWKPCDHYEKFEQKCKPRKADCVKDKVDFYGTRGLGKSMLYSYSKAANLIFEEGCAPKIIDKNIKNIEKFGDPDEYTMFSLQHFLEVPPVVIEVGKNKDKPAQDDLGCAMYALTMKPRKKVAQRIEHTRALFPQDKRRPVLGFQVQTGWSDETLKRAGAWERLGECADYPQYSNTTAYSIRDDKRGGVTLAKMTNLAATAADSAFGKGNWVPYISSDSEAVRRYAGPTLSDRSGFKSVMVPGTIGHNNGKRNKRTKEENIDISTTTITDFVLLSEVDLLIYISAGSFPTSVIERAMCPQRSLGLTAYPRHPLADAGRVLEKGSKKGKGLEKPGEPWIPDLDDDLLKDLKAAVPKGRRNPCWKDEFPSRACLCYYKLAHMPVLDN